MVFGQDKKVGATSTTLPIPGMLVKVPQPLKRKFIVSPYVGRVGEFCVRITGFCVLPHILCCSYEDHKRGKHIQRSICYTGRRFAGKYALRGLPGIVTDNFRGHFRVTKNEICTDS